MNKSQSVYKSTSVDEQGAITDTFYTELKLNQAEYKKKFGHGYAVKKNQKTITTRDYITEQQFDELVSLGAVAKYKN